MNTYFLVFTTTFNNISMEIYNSTDSSRCMFDLFITKALYKGLNVKHSSLNGVNSTLFHLIYMGGGDGYQMERVQN